VELSDRKEQILSAIVERFIATGEPVGSKLLAAMLPLSVSPATIRNEMASLSEKGYLDQPHTSAGRIPSDKGYRYYIDRLLQNYAPSDADMFRILSRIDHSEGDSNAVLSQICEILAELTGCAAAVSSPDPEGADVKNAQVVPISRNSAMVLVTTTAGVLKNRIARLDREPDYDMLELFYNVVSANFTGVPLSAVTAAKIQSAAASLEEKALDLMPLLVSFYECVSAASESTVTVKGHSNLLNVPELRASAPEILDLLGSEEALQRLLRISTDAPVELSIGTENAFPCLRSATIIRAAYKPGGGRGGTVAVIGPTKSDYARIIPLVKYISGVTGAVLTELSS
jgi:heat-inducible transcriptional repressor